MFWRHGSHTRQISFDHQWTFRLGNLTPDGGGYMQRAVSMLWVVAEDAEFRR